MNITRERTDEFKNKFEELIRHYDPQGNICQEKFLMELCDYAVEQSRNHIPERLELSQDHRTGVSNTQLDYNMFFLAAVLISWAVRMRKVKSDEGQCWTHTTNCPATRQLHSSIYDEWIGVLEETLEALRADRPGR
jgi:hypothetical protein